jgi:hypothetical protein
MTSFGLNIGSAHKRRGEIHHSLGNHGELEPAEPAVGADTLNVQNHFTGVHLFERSSECRATDGRRDA